MRPVAWLVYDADMAAKRIQDIRKIFTGGNDRVSAEDAKILDRMMTQARSTDDVDRVLEFANKALAGYGIVAIEGMWHDRYYQDIVALNVNMGDSYATTILYDAVKGKFHVMSWGDFVEKKSRAYKIK